MYDIEHVFWMRRDESKVSRLDNVHRLFVDIVKPTHDLVFNSVQVLTGCVGKW